MATTIETDHPRLLADVFGCTFPKPLGELPSPDWLTAMLGESPGLQPDQTVRNEVRGLLRWGGFKPSGRSKPASEFLEKARAAGTLGSINLAVDLCNVVSLWSGFPISVIDLELAAPPLEIQVVREKKTYVFNPSGQELDLEGLVCLCDQQGPCGSPVKDSQRTKTHSGTIRTVCLIWGVRELAAQVEHAGRWYRELCERAGATVSTWR